MTAQNWIITGASAGFGRAIAEAALVAGDTVVAAVRRPEAVADLVGRHPDTCTAVAFDARDTARTPELVRAATDR